MSELGLNESDWLNLIGNATDLSHGDIALPCHSLSKFLKRSPNDIADEINRYIQENPIEQPDDTYEYGITNGYEFGHDAFDTANGYCSY